MSHKAKVYTGIFRASKGRGFVSPHYSPLTRRIINFISPLYLKKVEGVSSIAIENLDILFEAYKDHFNRKRQLIIAFRHVSKEDAPVLMLMISKKLNKAIHTYNKKVDKEHRIIAHAQFLYGADVLEWAGELASFVFPRLGAIPIINRSNNTKGLSLLRETMKKGVFPVALAPESQVTYHVGKVEQTSSGISSLAMWGENVSIIPIALGYHYHKDTRSFIMSVVKRWEKETLISVDKENLSLHDTLLFITQETVKLLEEFYHIPISNDLFLKDRIDTICHKALSYAQYIAHSKVSGSLLDRLFHIRHIGILGQKPENFETIANSPIATSLLDIKALHAHIFLMHSSIVDVLMYVDPSYITLPCSIERMNEYALNILDVVNRMRGGNINSRYSPKGKEALVFIGDAIDIYNNSTLSRKENRNIIETQVKEALESVSNKVEEKWMNETIIH